VYPRLAANENAFRTPGKPLLSSRGVPNLSGGD
jgi:hypothetical protein